MPAPAARTYRRTFSEEADARNADFASFNMFQR
jgi:hypothetical protein